MFDYAPMGQRVRRKRKEKRMTQERLAEKAEISISFLGHIERGTRKASLETFVSLANALETDANYLLMDSLEHDDGFVEYTNATPAQQDILRKIAVILLDDTE